jgi:hypothetical protein
MISYIRSTGLLLGAVALGAACDRSDDAPAVESATDMAGIAAGAGSAGEGPQVSNVMIGRRLGPGNRITEPTYQFSPDDTVHISVATEGGGSGMLTAAWRSQNGEIVQKTTEAVHVAGENTSFSLSSPKGLRPGTYKVVLFLDQDSVDTRVFVVAK